MGFQNFYASRLYTDIGASDTTITLETPPTKTSGRLTLEARNATQREIISYANVSGNDITGVVRGIGGTTAKTHIKNALVEMNAVGEDLQDLYDAINSFSATNNDWRLLAYTPSSVTANGNRSYTCVFSGVNLTNILSPGMRLRTTRTVPAPTQSSDLEASSSQYYSKAAPVAMTFTDDFTVSAWIKMESYAADTAIASRFDGSSGWIFFMGADGRLVLSGYNAGAANASRIISSQSVPLNKWVHVAAQLDMSAFTATTTTSYVMIDGVDVAATVSRSGTNPTALVQAGNLNIGAYNAGSFFDGKLAQVAIYNAKVTQATIRASMNQTLSGSETSLISAYSFNGIKTDLNTTNANNLTANGGAVETNADSPFGGQASGLISSTLEYAEIVSATFAVDTTLVLRVPDVNAIPTTGGVSAVSYSGVNTPYGFPGISNILGYAIVLANTSATALSPAQASGLSVTVTVPPYTKTLRLSCQTGLGVSGGTNGGVVSIWDGTVGSGSQLIQSNMQSAGSPGLVVSAVQKPTAGTHTYNVGLNAITGGTATMSAIPAAPIYLMVEMV